MKKIINKLASKAQATAATVQSTLATRRGEFYVDKGVVVLIAVVLGAMLLTAMYTLYGDTVIPKVTEAITSLFNYEGAITGLG